MLSLREIQLLTLALVAKTDYYRCNPDVGMWNDVGRARKWITENIGMDFDDGELEEFFERIKL